MVGPRKQYTWELWLARELRVATAAVFLFCIYQQSAVLSYFFREIKSQFSHGLHPCSSRLNLSFLLLLLKWHISAVTRPNYSHSINNTIRRMRAFTPMTGRLFLSSSLLRFATFYLVLIIIISKSCIKTS